MSVEPHVHLHEFDLDDDALELAAGGIILCSNPSTCNKNATTNYTYNSTIYFQTSITSTVT